jgi:hypothetical protein
MQFRMQCRMQSRCRRGHGSTAIAFLIVAVVVLISLPLVVVIIIVSNQRRTGAGSDIASMLLSLIRLLLARVLTTIGRHDRANISIG